MSQTARTCRTILCASAMVGAALAAGRAASAADHPNLQPGNWEVAISTEMPGAPQMPAVTGAHCIKPEEVRDSRSFAETMAARNKGKCKISDVKFESDKLSYGFACESGGTGTTELVFAGTTYEATTKMTISRPGKAPMAITQHIKGKRLGDC